MRISLDALTNHALASTSLLDHAYYSLLEHISFLHDGIEQFSILSADVRKVCSDHDRQVDQACKDLQRQMESFGRFDYQAQRVCNLENRLKHEVDMFDELQKRLSSVRKRLRDREREDAENWKQTRCKWDPILLNLTFLLIIYSVRLRILWGTVVSLLLLFCAIAVFQNFWAIPSAESTIANGERSAVGTTSISMIMEDTKPASTESDELTIAKDNGWQNVLDEL